MSTAARWSRRPRSSSRSALTCSGRVTKVECPCGHPGERRQFGHARVGAEAEAGHGEAAAHPGPDVPADVDPVPFAGVRGAVGEEIQAVDGASAHRVTADLVDAVLHPEVDVRAAVRLQSGDDRREVPRPLQFLLGGRGQDGAHPVVEGDDAQAVGRTQLSVDRVQRRFDGVELLAVHGTAGVHDEDEVDGQRCGGESRVRGRRAGLEGDLHEVGRRLVRLELTRHRGESMTHGDGLTGPRSGNLPVPGDHEVVEPDVFLSDDHALLDELLHPERGTGAEGVVAAHVEAVVGEGAGGVAGRAGVAGRTGLPPGGSGRRGGAGMKSASGRRKWASGAESGEGCGAE